MKKGAILDMKGARLGNKKVRNWVMKKTHKKGARLGKKGAKMDKSPLSALVVEINNFLLEALNSI